MVLNPFQGRLVRLRALEPGDAPAFQAWLNDPEVSEHLAVRYPLSRHMEDEFTRAQSTSYDDARFAAERIDTGELIGGAAIRTQAKEDRRCELGLAIDAKELWGQGYGTDLVEVLLAVAFLQMDLNRVELWVHSPNERGQRTYAKCGFVVEGVAREAFYKNGVRQDAILMSVLRREWDARRGAA